MRSIVWFRGKDLRTSDHAPLHAAAASGDVIPLFVLDPYFFAPTRAARMPHRMQFLVAALGALETSLNRLGSRLLLVAGRSTEVVPRLVHATRADRVLAYRWTEPFGRERDRRIAAALGDRFQLFHGETLLPPGTLRSETARPYSVFGAFERAFRDSIEVGAPNRAPALRPLPPDVAIATAALPAVEDLGLRPNPAILRAGEVDAQRRLRAFVTSNAAAYPAQRHRVDRSGTSRLSADIKFGTVSIRQVWSAVHASATMAFRTQLIWREFAYDTLWNRPDVLERPFQRAFDGFPWRDDEEGWQAWAAGRTGYPIVDAAARQLVTEGYVPNRARMIAASFLTKHLLIDYRRGEAHYMRWLTDGDWANNNAGWQWVVGCGNGAQPYFRVFNPVLQGERFDPDGEYVRRWVPELEGLPARYVHRPWMAPSDVLRSAGVRLGGDYPAPVVDHELARERFLAHARGHLSRANHEHEEWKS